MLEKAMSELEARRLAGLEATVERGLTTFLEVGTALQEIRDDRLYRETHATFESYCSERFGFSASRGRQLIAASKTVTQVTVLGLPAPKSEREAREMARKLREEAARLDPDADRRELIARAKDLLAQGDAAMSAAVDEYIAALDADSGKETRAEVMMFEASPVWWLMEDWQREKLETRLREALA